MGQITHGTISASLVEIKRPKDPCPHCGQPIRNFWMVEHTGEGYQYFHNECSPSMRAIQEKKRLTEFQYWSV